jgi:glycosyltransferase involved in cell wall biosynthesis
MLLAKPIRFDTRVRKEAETLAAAGYRVRVFAVGPPGVERSNDVEYAGYELRRTTRDAWRRHRARQDSRLPRFARAFAVPGVHAAYYGKNAFERQLYLHAHEVARHFEVHASLRLGVEEFQPQVIHAHDLATLEAGRRCARRLSVPLVYDAHELEVYARARRTRYGRAVARVVERLGVREAAQVIASSPGMADELRRMYPGIRPAVVLNSQRLRSRDAEPPISLRAACAANDDVVVVYTGLLIAGRGLEQAAAALALLPGRFRLAIVGPREPGPEQALLERARAVGVADRVHLVDPVPAHLLPAVVATGDIAIIPLEKTGLSYEAALPNKLFDAILAGAPIATSSVQATSAFVRRHELGEVFDVERPESIAAAIATLADTVPAGIADRDRLRRLQEEIAWEQQEPVLRAVYEELGISIATR